MSDVRPIRSEQDYVRALAEIMAFDDEAYAPGRPESDRFDVLVTLVEAYEARVHPVPEADPVQILHFAIEDMGRSQSELADILGSKSRASEILNRRRPLTLDMIRSISRAWKIPRDALADSYELAAGARARSKRVVAA